MKMLNGIWTATIPGQSEGVRIKFFLEAFDNSGNSVKTVSTSYTTAISNSSPVAVLESRPSIVYTNEFVEFDASASYDSDGLIVSYVWDFGDGTTATGAIISHTYMEDGNYVVTLTIIDNDGMETIKTTIQVVKNKPPVAKLIESGTFVNKKEPITFDASSSYDYDGIIVYYYWDFGDGTTTNGKTVSHSYDTIGFFTLTLTVTDNDGASDKICVTKIVMNNFPIALLTNASETATVGENILFDASASYDSDGLIVSYVWDFGDGTTATGMTTDHEYGEEGTFIVTLTVIDDNGNFKSLVDEINVELELAVSLAIISVIALGITTLTTTLLYGLFERRKKNE
jgi:PKD repeat protein